MEQKKGKGGFGLSYIPAGIISFSSKSVPRREKAICSIQESLKYRSPFQQLPIQVAVLVTQGQKKCTNQCPNRSSRSVRQQELRHWVSLPLSVMVKLRLRLCYIHRD